MSNIYSFTTDTEDDYFQRVIEEATGDTRFILVTERNTVSGETPGAVLFVRKGILLLGLAFPDLPLAGRTLGEWLTATLEETSETEWTFSAFEASDTEDLQGELTRVRNEIHRIDNILNDRIIRATVESF